MTNITFKEANRTLTSDWQSVKWVLTDVDDTLTWEGHLPPDTLIALDQLQKAGIKVVAVTGACAGWCDHIAQLWPVDAVLGENGAFKMEKEGGFLTLKPHSDGETMANNQAKLKQQVLDILSDYPELNLTLDQSYRLCEVAIDIGQNRPRVDENIINEILTKVHALGAYATASSIHINCWYGEHSKKIASLAYLENNGLTGQTVFEQSCYIGDSMNDQNMFEILPKSVGVANIEKYWQQLAFRPSIVMGKPGGYGFAEFADKLLALQSDK
ncbi:HAD-IIB family hydrolase [Vibrio sp. SS-MA-C1-2]|uniref:HAD-IIB family hydrolase n=1 Tax=Vibrio sp. SS-MA-C1-2 TaxID=2908646 RepID=UPI001F247682|nr:HAD-IIB family hydrolase [Vibrio sp. SS-MA-C1-2]UJF17872.1 HAD-IIB family hydrolase [Vibrio sp. SS-MA-C1-2]